MDSRCLRVRSEALRKLDKINIDRKKSSGKVLLVDSDEQEQFEFLQEHEIIRDLSSYGHIVRAAIHQQPAIPEPVEA